MPNESLSGVTVLDLSQFVAGPYCTKLLSDFGADVVKIEKPGVGDIARRYQAAGSDPEAGPLFLYLNTGKRSVALDVEDEEGAALFRRLVAGADVVVEGFRPGFLDRLELSYSHLKELNPGLLMVSITPFGQTGPYTSFESSEIVCCALGGLMYLTGLPEREPLKVGGFQSQYQAGIHAAVATLSALHFREEMGLGQHVDVSEVEVLASILEDALVAYAYTGEVRRRSGSRHHFRHPVNLLPCKDGLVAVVIPTWIDMGAFARLSGISELADRRFEAAYGDPATADEVDALIILWLRERTRSEVFELAQSWRLPFAPVLSVDELLADPQLEARGYFVDIDHPVAGPLVYPGAPFVMSQSPALHFRAPLLGEHTEEVLRERLGLGDEELMRLVGESNPI